MTPIKAELHLHLEGSVEPATLCELDPSLTIEQARARYNYAGFRGFLDAYKWVNLLLRSPEDYALITRRLLERLASENVVHAEINLSAGVVLWKGQDLAAMYEAARAEAERSPVRVLWIYDAVRQFGPEAAMRVAEFAAGRAGEGVIGFGIGGDESRLEWEEFADAIRLARSAGLRFLPHAGETTGPESVWGALRLGAERIGHGIRSVDDPVLMRHLRDNDIPLEICISSNVATGAVPSLEEHPLRRLFDAGVPVVLNTDDPAMFHTTLVREYEIAAEQFGFTEPELRILAENSLRYATGAPIPRPGR